MPLSTPRPTVAAPLPMQVLEEMLTRGGVERTGMAGRRVWFWTPRRHRPFYICSAGVTHDHWWLLHQPGGTYPIVKACNEHEVSEWIDPTNFATIDLR